MADPSTSTRSLRCAIYTRKSTDEGLEQDFNSLQAQREASEAYIQSQRQNGWVLLSERYDDGGFSGASLERPALQRLMAGIDAGLIDCVIVYKVDRLSRSLLDFARLMERFDRQRVSFVSVTQDFNTTTSLGRLTLNILLSFAQFEREIISERTRDKLSAARRKGKWIGGWPVLGYDIDPKGGRLVINAKEAAQVREMYEIAGTSKSLEAALRVIQARGLQTKNWKTRAGRRHAARPFSRMTLRLLLSNVLYTGAVNHKGTVYPGEHERIVERELWERVNAELSARSTEQRGRPHRSQTAPLREFLFCAACGSAMSPSYTTKNGRRHCYYVCPASEKRADHACSQRPVAATHVEGSILKNLEPVLGVGLNWTTVRDAVRQVRYESLSQKVLIDMKSGTQLTYEMNVANRSQRNDGDQQPDAGRVPRVSRLLALAIKFERSMKEGAIRNYRDIAAAGHISRARMSQIMRLTELAPSIQEEILFLPKILHGPDRITEKALRKVARALDWDEQKQRFEALKGSDCTRRSL